MRIHQPARTSGFTLVELLVVIAIIAVLASLTTTAAFYAYWAMMNARNASEIGQMSVGLETFKGKFGVYPPSIIHLKEDGSYNTALPLDAHSLYYLKKMWPRLAFPIDWDGDGTTTGNFTLEGDQCLVFFLGGLQPPLASTVKGTLGFSTSVINPADRTDLTNRVGPFYTFEPNRLVRRDPSSPFQSFMDTYGLKPFAYFSSGRKNNNYNPTPFDCPSIGAAPYVQPTGLYHNSDTFQIISAGKNGIFGGGLWDPAAAAATITPAGFDDRSNFAKNILGAGNE